MLINILIRTSYRPDLFQRCLDSIRSQTHLNVRIIVSYDDDRAISYIPVDIEKIRVYKNESLPFFYDNYCNELKQMVSSGFFFFLDDDDVLASDRCLEIASKHLKKNYGLVMQFSRGGNLKPSSDLIKRNIIKRGSIGMPCLILHSSLKNIADFDGSKGAADYTWIKAVSKRVKLKFIPIVIAFADRRSNGIM